MVHLLPKGSKSRLLAPVVRKGYEGEVKILRHMKADYAIFSQAAREGDKRKMKIMAKHMMFGHPATQLLTSETIVYLMQFLR